MNISEDDNFKQGNASHGIAFSLPRPQRRLPKSTDESARFESLGSFLNDAWSKEKQKPTHAWIRYSLSVGLPLEEFAKKFKKLLTIRHAFGRMVLIAPASIDHHEIEVEDFDFMVNPETGQQEIEVKWHKKRCDGGSHIIFVVESSAEEYRVENSAGIEPIEALESLVRITLGAMLVINRGFNRSMQRFVDIALPVFHSLASCVAVRSTGVRRHPAWPARQRIG